ncbi:MAG: hypothetical protein UX14_C0027G0009 [Parcubacteria group bacterium GW2011_GWF1_45_5]|nr:MAG: hypothetical protein UX14_C0027G0009 [Parcubacteria group bacterium GW2011_GWF1_45_5]
MAGNKEKITQYFSNVVVRTMRKDLETLKTGGGLITYTPESIEKSEPFTQTQTTPINIVVPVLVTPDLNPAAQQVPLITPRPSAENTSPQNLSSVTPPQQKQDRSSFGLFMVLGAIVVVLGGSLAYWFIYRKGGSPAPTPTPTVSPTESPSPNPIKENPTITLSQSTKTSTLTLGSSTFPVAVLTHLEEQYLATTSLAIITLVGTDGEYLKSDAFIENVSPDSLKSFRATIDTGYALVVYAPEQQTRFLGAVIGIKPGSLATAKTIMQNWETANMEEYFKPLFAHHGTARRTNQKFTTETIKGHEFGFVNNYFVITTHATLTKTVIDTLSE